LAQPSFWQRRPPPCAMQNCVLPCTDLAQPACWQCLHGLGSARVLAVLAPSVRDTVLRVALGRLAAAVVLAAAPSAVRAAVLGGALGRLVAALVLASLAASVRLAMRSAARHCALYARLVLAAAHVHSAPAKPAPPPRRRERRALPVCLVYDVSHAVPCNASRTRAVGKEISLEQHVIPPSPLPESMPPPQLFTRVAGR
jgi:hypothetical protein